MNSKFKMQTPTCVPRPGGCQKYYHQVVLRSRWSLLWSLYDSTLGVVTTERSTRCLPGESTWDLLTTSSSIETSDGLIIMIATIQNIVANIQDIVIENKKSTEDCKFTSTIWQHQAPPFKNSSLFIRWRFPWGQSKACHQHSQHECQHCWHSRHKLQLSFN